MKRAFTLIELVFVIVVLGIISMFGADLYTQIYRSYIHTRAVNQLEARTQNVITLISSRLEDRIKGTTIGRINSNDNMAKNFDDISSITANHDVLEWIGQSIETKNIGNSRPGWSGFIDLKSIPATEALSRPFSINTQGSSLNGSIVPILQNLRRGSNSTVDSETFGIIFRSTTSDLVANIQTFYGYAGDGTRINIATANASDTNGEVLTIENYPTNAVGQREFSEQYYLAHTAYALVPVPPASDPSNADLAFAPGGVANGKNFDLQLRYNYRPWEAEQYNSNIAMRALVAQDVSLFRFRDDNGAVALKLCMRDNGRNFSPTELDLIVCKSQVVY